MAAAHRPTDRKKLTCFGFLATIPALLCAYDDDAYDFLTLSIIIISA
jgi:hypothetical protein